MWFFGKKKPAQVQPKPQPAPKAPRKHKDWGDWQWEPVELNPHLEAWIRKCYPGVNESSRRMSQYMINELKNNVFLYRANEMNMVNFDGTPTEYFRYVLEKNFPEYTLRENMVGTSRQKAVSFALEQAGRPCLTVVLMEKKHRHAALDQILEKMNVPVLRFYIDHYNWCNPEYYVCNRIRRELGI